LDGTLSGRKGGEVVVTNWGRPKRDNIKKTLMKGKGKKKKLL